MSPPYITPTGTPLPPTSELNYDDRVEARLVRIETRLVLLMRAHNLDVNGKKLDAPTAEEPQA